MLFDEVALLRLRRIDPDRRGNVLDRFFRPAQLAISRRTVAVGARALRLETERLVIILDGAVIFFGIVESIAAI
ncbi:hypothetical protein V1293_005607 [Bradyrhizobium sp. AZCC 1693]